MDWLDLKSHPRLVLDGEDIEVAYQPVALDHGGGPIQGAFKVQCVVKHLTGALVYTADDVTMEPPVFAEFAGDLKQVLDGIAQDATLAPVGDELVVTVKRVGKDVQMHIAVTEWQGPYDPETIMSAGCMLNMDRTYRWVRELKEYGRLIDEWVLANPAT
jgi:hypothetical protein